MDVQIDTGIEAPSKPQERRKSKRVITVPSGVKGALRRYSEAYKAVYGILPECRWDGAYIRCKGQEQGVTMKRMREMIKQLRWRNG
jgi:hypothetical protein